MTVEQADIGAVIGHEAAQAALNAAFAADRMHHGWLFHGPRGIGKMRLALQFALRLLEVKASGFDIPASDPTARRVLSGGHPDIRIVQRPVDENGKTKTEIPVETVRELVRFFALRPGVSGRRVAIIDAVDELNRFGANALLKILEEPPEGGVLILISHGEQAQPPTIRSRCRLLRLAPLPDEAHQQVLRTRTEGETAPAADLWEGRPGLALRFASADVEDARKAAIAALSALGRGGREAAGFVAAASRSDEALAVALEVFRQAVRRRMTRFARAVEVGDHALAWLDLSRIEAESRELNMDRAQTAALALRRVTELARGRA